MKTPLRPAVLLPLLLILALTLPSLPAAAAPAREGPVAEAAPLADPPVLVAPLYGATTTGVSDPPLGVPTLQWMPVTGATLYHVQVSTSAGFATVVIEKDTYATTYTPEIAFADREYYWRVKARIGTAWDAYANAWTFNKDWSNNETNVPQLLSQAEGAERGAFQPADFSWTEVDGAATYRLEISIDPGFGSTAYSATTIKAQHTPTLRLPNNEFYFWRVIPIDYRGNAGAPSLTGSFKFKWVQSPQLLAPPHQEDQTFLPRFSWTAVEAAKQYRLEISTQPDFSNPSSLTVYVTSQTD